MPVIRAIPFDPATAVPLSGLSGATNLYKDPTGAMKAGLWVSEPKRVEIAYTSDEFCVLLQGEVTLTDAEGRSTLHRAGEAFLIPAGFKGVWENKVAVRKYYVLHTPRPMPAG
jgi:uncharacterized cupin superfamily protein